MSNINKAYFKSIRPSQYYYEGLMYMGSMIKT